MKCRGGGSGKTTLAAGVAQVLGWPHFDKDQFLEQRFDDEGIGDTHVTATQPSIHALVNDVLRCLPDD